MEDFMKKQLTISDYNENGDMVLGPVVDTATMEDVDRVELEQVDYNSMTKAELITVLKQKDGVLGLYETKLHDIEAKHENDMQSYVEFYNKELDGKNKLIAYYERKMKLIKDIITIELGDEK